MAARGTAPVIVGVAQVANKHDDRIVHPVELLEEACRRALADVGADLRDRIGWVGATPLSVFSTDNGGAMVAERLGLPPGPRAESRYSGAAPQRLLAEACQAIGAGTLDAALVVGGIGDASVRRAHQQGVEPPAPPTSVWSQGSSGVGDNHRLRPGRWIHASAEADAGAHLPASYFALAESAIRARARRAVEDHQLHLGQLLAPFTEVAARRPEVAWFPTARDALDIATPTPENRLVAEPYTKAMCSFPTVDLAAAVIVCSTELADRLGIARDHRVHPWALSAAKEPGPPSHRPDMGRSAALAAAVRSAFADAGTHVDQIDTFDLYSCFPAAVEIAVAAFGLAPGDERPLTCTGGLPYFGGPGASYSLHSVVSVVEEMRARPGALAAVVGLGGMIDDFSVGLYSVDGPSAPMTWRDLGEVGPSDPGRAVAVVDHAEGDGIVEAGTVLHDRDRGPIAAPAVVRLADGARVGARVAGGIDAAAELRGLDLVGRAVRLHTVDGTVRYELA
jgi:acetyl-CoA C-acetyltransferase